MGRFSCKPRNSAAQAAVSRPKLKVFTSTIAKKSGFNASPRYEERDIDSLAEIIDPVHQAGVRTLSAIDLFAIDRDALPPVDWQIEGLVHSRGLWFLSGMPKRGKSIIRRHVAVCTTLGEPFFGHEVKQGRVLMLADEDELVDEQRVMEWLARSMSRHPEELVGKILIIPAQGFQLDNGWDIEAIKYLIKKLDPILVMFDPLIRYHTKEENSSTEMQAVIRPLAEMARTRCVGVLHHTDKDGKELRGTSDLLASYRSLWRIKAREADLTNITVEPKLKAGATPDLLRVGYFFDDKAANIGIKQYGTPDGAKQASQDSKLRGVKEAVLKELREAGGSFPTKSKLAEAVGGNRNMAFKAILCLYEDGLLKDTAEGVSLIESEASAER